MRLCDCEYLGGRVNGGDGARGGETAGRFGEDPAAAANIEVAELRKATGGRDGLGG